MTIIGTDINIKHPVFEFPSAVSLPHPSVSIGDTERASGLYILGKPRMGKSWLMVNLALQDIENPRGLFFLDPHGDAISDIFARTVMYIFPGRHYLLDPEDSEYTFGINLLQCNDPDNPKERAATFARAKGVFDKLWKSTFEEKPWLQLILQNSLYALIENQGYTLAELPLFFRDTTFRSHICENIKYNTQVRDYWLKTFAAKEKREQDIQMEAAQTRAEIMLGHPYVRDIVGQAKTTVDFSSLMERFARIFVRLSATLSMETKKIIGTILISELLHAIERRPPDKRHQFCIYIDEFQNFAAYQDFSTLITQAPKYGIATTLAHHDRFGQLGDNKEIIGATAAIANKVLFQVTGRDARDFAPEFRKDPPEAQDGDVYVISQAPFYDLLQGHSNPQVCALVDKYLRPIKERAEDIIGDRETERLLRTEYLDEANLYRVDERIATAGRGRDEIAQRGALGRVTGAISKAKSQMERLKELNEESVSIRVTIRVLNKLFIEIMDGKLKAGLEDFSNRLIAISKAAVLPPEDRRILELFIGLAFGETGKRRILPFECAKRQGIFRERIEKIENEINTEYETQRAAFARAMWQMFERNIGVILKENVTIYNKDREIRREPKMNLAEIEEERKHLERRLSAKIDMYEMGKIPDLSDSRYGHHTLFRLIEDLTKDLKPLVRRQPEDFTIGYGVYIHSIKKDLMERGFREIIESIEGLVELCLLLGKPENHVQVKTKQRGKKVESRTIADMTNEMEGELTELPKYTAYAKVLQGQQVWKGKIKTNSVGEEKYNPLCFKDGDFRNTFTVPYKDLNYRNLTMFTRRDLCQKRIDIEEEIRKRQENWRPTVEEPEIPIEEPKKPEPPKKAKTKKEEPPPPWY